MKVVLITACWIFGILCCVFPFTYTKSDIDKAEVKLSHILVNTEDEAKNIRAEILEGKSFEEMAEKYSLCESKAQKGDIGYNMRNHLFKEIENAAFTMKKHELSEPIKTENGWHLVKVYDIKYFSDKDNFNEVF